MTEDATSVPPTPSPDEMARMLAAAPAMPSPRTSPRSSLRGKLVGAILIAGIGVGASIMSCVGQSFSLRQARALEGIEQQLVQIRSSCAAAPVGREVAR